jgi:uncharacterized tellurite resistance protein B-like protein
LRQLHARITISAEDFQVFDALKNFVSELASGDKQAGDFAADDFRVAYAALLVHAAAIDGEVSGAERSKLVTLLKQRFDLDDEAAKHLVEQATAADARAVDLYHFTRLLNETLDEPGRLRMIETMWNVAFVDGAASEYEDNLIWRVSDLLGVSSSERIALRQRVAAARSGGA